MRFPLVSSYPCYREPTPEREITKTGYFAFASDKYASDDDVAEWMTIAEKGHQRNDRPQVVLDLLAIIDHISTSPHTSPLLRTLSSSFITKYTS
jgi:hypothetical protein